jgi:hypothetical protein
LTRRIEPNQDLAALYRGKYTRYQAVIEALDSVWT